MATRAKKGSARKGAAKGNRAAADEKRSRKAEGAETLIAALDAECVRLLRAELDRHEKINSNVSKSKVVRWLIMEGLAEDSPLGKMPKQY